MFLAGIFLRSFQGLKREKNQTIFFKKFLTFNNRYVAIKIWESNVMSLSREFITLVGVFLGGAISIITLLLKNWHDKKLAKLNFWYQYQKDVVINVLLKLEQLKTDFYYFLNDPDDPESHLVFIHKILRDLIKELLKLKFILPNFPTQIIDNLYKISNDLAEISLCIHKKYEGFLIEDLYCPELEETEMKVKNFLEKSQELEHELMKWLKSNI